MSDCDKNCEAVANLNEYAANLIEYSKRIDRWVNGNQTEFVDVGGVQTPTLRNLAMMIKALMGVHPDDKTIFINQDKEIYVKLSALIQNGGGLGIDDQGKLYVDASSMNTEVFENLMAKLRLPLWLDSNTHFYVSNNGIDDTSEGRGLSAIKPWKTIQFAVNYICDNYNMNKFNAIIHVDSGIYNENIILGGFTTSIGSITIIGTGYGNVIINGNENASTIRVISGNWKIYDLRINMDLRGKIFPQNIVRYRYPIQVETNANLEIGGLKLFSICDSNINSSVHLATINVNNGNLKIIPRTQPMYLETYNTGVISSSFIENAFNGKIELQGTNENDYATQILCSGSCENFYNGTERSSFFRGTDFEFPMNFGTPSNLSVTGRRYYLWNGAVASCYGGPNFFPGDIDGVVEQSTYSWYK